MKFRRNRNDDGALVEMEGMNETMIEKPKKGFNFSFDIGYSINVRRSDIFAVKISTT